MAVTTIADLPAPVTAAKADWLAGYDWIGFTPASDSPGAAAQCAATINRQIGNGYVIEYITRNFGKVNPGFESDPRYLEERAAHAVHAGRLVAVHRLWASYRPLRAILGGEEFERVQDMWAEERGRRRWSVTFPIVESWEVEGSPLAREVLGDESMRRVFAHPSGTLRPLEDGERDRIASLRIRPRKTRNAWIAIEDEVAMAEGSDLPPGVVRAINADLAAAAMEGMTEEQRAKVRRRAAWLANRFVLTRQQAETLRCDGCGWDPARRVEEPALLARLAGQRLRLRSLLEVHHLHPLEEGARLTTVSDFAMLCPTCHVVEHAVLRAERART